MSTGNFDDRKKKDRKAKREKRRIRKLFSSRVIHSSWADWDVMFYKEVTSGKGFLVTENSTVKIDGETHFTMHGTESPLFGTAFGDEADAITKYRCRCGEFKGLQWKGYICPKCKSEIKSREVELDKTAWISIAPNYIIHPYWYQILINVFGSKGTGKDKESIFYNMIHEVRRVDKDGNRLLITAEDGVNILSPFTAIGIDGFLERFDEIIHHFKTTKPGKIAELNIIQKNKKYIFCR